MKIQLNVYELGAKPSKMRHIYAEFLTGPRYGGPRPAEGVRNILAE